MAEAGLNLPASSLNASPTSASSRAGSRTLTRIFCAPALSALPASTPTGGAPPPSPRRSSPRCRSSAAEIIPATAAASGALTSPFSTRVCALPPANASAALSNPDHAAEAARTRPRVHHLWRLQGPRCGMRRGAFVDRWADGAIASYSLDWQRAQSGRIFFWGGGRGLRRTKYKTTYVSYPSSNALHSLTGSSRP